MSCPDPLHDYEDWTDENGDIWEVGYYGEDLADCEDSGDDE